MSHSINYSTIGWEQFEDLCSSLWFDEGYRNIRPYGRRGEGGRDAVYYDEKSGDLVIFQFKRWTGKYTPSALKDMIKEAAEKVSEFHPNKLILNSAYDPNPDVNDWIHELSSTMGFGVDYCDRSWIDLRLDNSRQDLRSHYFGLQFEHHSWESLVATSSNQVRRAIEAFAPKFDQDCYVTREAENRFVDFDRSNKLCLVLVDKAGRGKTNLICALASKFQQQKKPVLLLRGDATLTDDDSFLQIVSKALGYDKTNYGAGLNDLAEVLKTKHEKCNIFVDGVSESDDLRRVRRSLINLMLRLAELNCFKICISCRDVVWPKLSHELPKQLLYRVFPLATSEDIDKYAYEFRIDDFSDPELDIAISAYSKKYNMSFDPGRTARDQLRHPLLLRFLCERPE